MPCSLVHLHHQPFHFLARLGCTELLLEVILIKLFIPDLGLALLDDLSLVSEGLVARILEARHQVAEEEVARQLRELLLVVREHADVGQDEPVLDE